MRRVLGIALVLAIVALLPSCAFLPSAPADDDAHQSAVEMQHIADAVKNGDATALKKLFSKTARQRAKNLDVGLRYFLDLLHSGRMTWRADEPPRPEVIVEGSKSTEELHAFYTVRADGQKYNLYFVEFTVNTAEDPNNVGLYALGIQPYTATTFTKSGATKPFYKWTGSFYNDNGVTYGNPGVYVPINR